MAPHKPKRKQTVLKRSEDGSVIYGERGKPAVERVVTARRGHFKRPASSASGPCVTRVMTDEERKHYGKAERLSLDERKRIGQSALCMTYDERWLHGY